MTRPPRIPPRGPGGHPLPPRKPVNLDGETIARATGGRLLRGGPAGPILTDTRALVPGAWFCALRGERFDAWDFLDRARDAGAVGCIVSREPPPGWSAGAVIVDDTTRALQDLGRHVRDRIEVPVVGITGSSGKTTTRALVALALSPLGAVHQTTGNLNNHLGVPMTLLATPDGAAGVVVEMGTSAPGEIRFLAELARPTVRLVVNVGPAHLEELGGLDGVAREKGALYATARPGDAAVVNADDARLAVMSLPRGVRRWTYGRARGADVRVVGSRLDPAALATDVALEVGGARHEVRIPSPGHHLAHNAAGAVACAVAVGVPVERAVEALAGYGPVGMRLRCEPLPGGGTALNDAYNANPQSMEASLRVLADLPGRRAAVLGDMLELGADEAHWHRRTVAFADGLGLDLLVLVGPRMAAARDAARHTEVWAAEDGMSLADRLRDWLDAEARVLFKGSRGARVERILQRVQGGSTDPGGR